MVAISGIISRYIAKSVVTTSLIVLLVLLTLDFFFSLINELEDLGQGQYDLAAVLLNVLLRLPRDLFEVVPMALLVGGLLAMGALANSRELLVLRAAGLSLLWLASAAVLGGVLLGMVALLISEFVAPNTEKLAQQLRAEAKYGGQAVASKQGFWARNGKEIVHVGAILPDASLADITLFTVSGAELESVTWAKKAQFNITNGQWVLFELEQIVIAETGIMTTTFNQRDWPSVLKPTTLSALSSDPLDLSLRDLSQYIRYLNDNELDASHYDLAFWLKVLSPLTNIAMLIVALPFAFTNQRKVGAGQRLLLGVLLGLLFFLLSRLLSNWVLLSGLAPILGAVLPTALFLAGGIIALIKLR